jgi:hypothetical protein
LGAPRGEVRNRVSGRIVSELHGSTPLCGRAECPIAMMRI